MVVVVIVSRILYRKEYMKENPVYRMQMLDKNHYFDLQISKAANYYSSYQLHQEQNKKKKISNDTISQAYAEIYAKLGHRFGAMCSYLEHFDYIANRQADADTLAGMDKELNGIENLIAQLNKLDTVNIQVETSMLDNDTERINFLIESLEELNENQ
jgi:Asp-tRNA(Asn)/Glu-tRNA(Gln) amidotransferase C subunit